MSMAVAALHTRRPITIDDARPIATSYPGFLDTMGALGADVAWAER